MDVNDPRNVWTETLPSLPTVTARAAIVSSLGASAIATRSYWPSVQYMSFTVTPAFLPIARTASARLVVSLYSATCGASNVTHSMLSRSTS